MTNFAKHCQFHATRLTATEQMTGLRYILLIAFIFLSTGAVSQRAQDVLRKKVSDNKVVFLSNLDKAFSELNTLLKEAEQLQDSSSIITILDRRCRYFYAKEDVNNLITATEKLKNKAATFNNYNAQAMSHVYLAEAYSMNQLFDKAIVELDKALALIEKTEVRSIKDFLTRTNILISQANVFNDKGNPREAVKRYQIAIKGYERIKNPENIRAFQYVNYSNIASIYVQFDIDSAEYYVQRSMALEPGDKESSILTRNYYLLGKIYQEKKNNTAALKYFLKANTLKNQNKEVQDLKDLYGNISLIYKNLGKPDSAAFFQDKAQELEIRSLENKYKSLHKVISNKTEPQEKYSPFILISLGLATVFIIALLLYFLKTRKAHKDTPETSLIETYDRLVHLAGKNDPAYLPSFEKAFPDFSEKLLHINPDLSLSEIEFCSLLKLNLSTKKIAQLKFIEPRTVQNKKHRIRKRLDIPSSTDLYNWFNKI